jgi:hypothetical protein
MTSIPRRTPAALNLEERIVILLLRADTARRMPRDHGPRIAREGVVSLDVDGDRSSGHGSDGPDALRQRTKLALEASAGSRHAPHE